MSQFTIVRFELENYQATENMQRVPVSESKFGAFVPNATKHAFSGLFIWGVGQTHRIMQGKNPRLVYNVYAVAAIPSQTGVLSENLLTRIANIDLKPEQLKIIMVSALSTLCVRLGTNAPSFEQIYLSSTRFNQSFQASPSLAKKGKQ